MDAFSYLSVLLSIILGLAITQILKGARGAVLARARIVAYWPTFAFAAFLLALAVQSWWSEFALREVVTWTFPMFTTVLVQTGVLYMLAALVLPDFFGEETVDLRAHYFDHRRLFFGLFLLLIAVSALRPLFFRYRMNATEQGFHVYFAACSLVGFLTAREWCHKVLALMLPISFIAFIGLLFAQLR